jgi:WhiB family redox-sensing transcriptional regulator
MQSATALIARRARCADPDSSYSHLFFSGDPINVARAKAICSVCTVRQLCLSTALQRQETYGVWGGELLVDGEIKLDIPRRGRPRKVSRIVVNVDEVTGQPIVA